MWLGRYIRPNDDAEKTMRPAEAYQSCTRLGVSGARLDSAAADFVQAASVICSQASARVALAEASVVLGQTESQ